MPSRVVARSLVCVQEPVVSLSCYDLASLVEIGGVVDTVPLLNDGHARQVQNHVDDEAASIHTPWWPNWAHVEVQGPVRQNDPSKNFEK